MINKNSHFNEPFLLAPACLEKIWGGTRLKKEFHKKSDSEFLAETWECSTHPDGLSYVVSGKHSGKTLKQVIEENPSILGSNLKGQNDLPILIKLIDAEQDLSVQVHPDDDYAKVHENNSCGKHEMWYVLDAHKNSKLVYGLSHSVIRDDLIEGLKNNQLKKYLQEIEVKKGDVFFIKPGVIHAIGAGVLLAEIQQNSNITYRLFDYNRIDKNGKKRELHVEKALQVADLKEANTPKQPMRVLKYSPCCASELLCRCRYFQVERLLVNTEKEKSSFETRSGSHSFIIFLCVSGSGNICYSKKNDIIFSKGDCVFLPADSTKITIYGKTELLRISC